MPAKPQHLALTHLERQVAEAAIGSRQTPHRQRHGGRGRRCGNGGKQPVHTAPHHVAHQQRWRHLGVVVAGHMPSVPQHDNAVADACDLGQAVAHIDEGHALGLQAHHLLEEAVGLLIPERRRRLVENQQARVQRQRLGDLDLLLRGHAQRAHLVRGGHIQPQPVQLGLCALDHGLHVDAPVLHQQATDKHVLCNRQVRQQPHFLVDQADARAQGVGGRHRRIGHCRATTSGCRRRGRSAPRPAPTRWTCQRRSPPSSATHSPGCTSRSTPCNTTLLP